MPKTKTKKVKAQKPASLPYLITLKTSDQEFVSSAETLDEALKGLNPGRLKMPGLLTLESEGLTSAISLTMFQMRRIFHLKGAIKNVAFDILSKRLMQNLK